MLVLLPVLALGTYVLGLKTRLAGWREAILGGATLWGVALVAITEALSLLHQLTVTGIAAAWLVVVLPGAAMLMRHGRLNRDSSPGLVPSLAWREFGLIGPLAAMLLVLAAVAVASPPNTWDSMTYHMARLIHWSQNASLAAYPTHIPRQLYLQPGAEFVLLHVQLLSGGDHLAGLVQWASMVGVVIGASLLACDLGASRPGALCASIFAASVPIGILESTSTQNDYVVAFWIVCSLTFALRLTRQDLLRPSLLTTAAFGASVGLALLTKATAYIVVLPILVWVAVCVARHAAWHGLGLLVIAGLVGLSLNAGFYARNLAVYGSPIGPLDEGAPSLRYVNEGFTPPLLVSNAVRDVGVNFNATPLVAINVRTLNFVRALHGWLGVDMADSRTTWGDQPFMEQPVGLAFDENFASNPAHLLLLLIAFGALWPLRRRLSPAVTVYALVVAAGFVLFCVILRWQPWHTRLELPFFVLGAPLVGVVAERIAPPFALGLAAVLLASMLPWVVYNQARPLVGPRSLLGFTRDERYFTNRPGLRTAYLGAVAYLVDRRCTHIGFVSTADGWEYPLWPLLQEAGVGPVRIEHVSVDNPSASQDLAASASQFDPCAVLVLGPSASMQSVEAHGKTFKPSWTALDPDAPLEQVAVLTADR